ncbi:signal peptidase I [Cellulomonas sp. P22]|uniref:signal peptidase I n=1 Tax=Cellulomonas sp. P22 TaxID=3373189 RepID=UPI003789C9EB
MRGTVANVALVAFLLGAVWALWPSNLGGCTTLTIVSGHSMEPTYYTGDLVVSRCGEAGVGDVVVYRPARENGGRVIHRVVGGDAETGWRMKGDNNDFTDPWTPTADEVLGVARLHVPHLGAVAAILLAPLTWMSVLVLAAAVLMWPSRRATAGDDAPDETAPDETSTDGTSPDDAVLDDAVPVGGTR